jgi:TolB-like protein
VGKVPPLTSPQGAVPANVQDACRRALNKEADARFATMGEFAAALDHPALRASRPEDPSIVVLPFENLSSDPENAFFADGLTEEIIADLSKVRSLRVISRSSAMSLKGMNKAIQEVCRDLQVRYALEGSVRRAGDNLRITAQLIDGRSDTNLWGDKYSGTSADIFELQEKLSREIVGALRITLTPDEDERLSARDISDVRIFEVCALARQEILRVTPEGLSRARKLIDDAIAHFGRSAPLLAMLANVHWNYVNWGLDVDEAHVNRARALAHEALVLDPENAGAHYTLAFIQGSRREVRSAIEHARRALLSRLYAKVGVHSRTELVHHLGERSPGKV